MSDQYEVETTTHSGKSIRKVVLEGELYFVCKDIASILKVVLRPRNADEKTKILLNGKEVVILNEDGVQGVKKRHQKKNIDLFVWLDTQFLNHRKTVVGEKRKRETDTTTEATPAKIPAVSNENSNDNTNEEQATEIKSPRQFERTYVSETIEDIQRELTNLRNELKPEKQKEGSDDDTDCSAFFQVLQNTVSQLKQDLCRKSVFFGNNREGKSFIINLLLRLTTVAPREYESSSRKNEIKEWRAEKRVQLEAELDLDESSQYSKPVWIDYSKIKPKSPTLDNIKRYCITGDATEIVKSSTFLLPSQSEGIITTPFVVRIKHGKLLHLKVEFQSEKWAKETAFVYPNALKQEFKSSASAVDTLRWQHITGKKGETYEDGELLPVTADDIEIDSNIQKFLGTTAIYAGQGKSWDMDREFIRQHLHELMGIGNEESRNLRSVIKKVTLYVPCALVEGGGELIDAPGANDSDPLSSSILSDILAEAHTLFVILNDRNLGASKNIFDCITGKTHEGLLGMSEFLFNMLQNPSMYHMVFLHNMENNPGAPKLIQLNEDSSAFANKCIKIKDTTANDVKNALIEFCKSTQTEPSADIETIVQKHISIQTCSPLLFTSLLLNREWAIENVTDLEEIEKLTAGWALLGQLEYVGHLTASNILGDFLHSLEIFLSQGMALQSPIMEELTQDDQTQIRALKGARSIKKRFDSEYYPLFKDALDNELQFEQILETILSHAQELESLMNQFTNLKQWNDLKKRLTKKLLVTGVLAPATSGQHRSFPLQQTLFGSGLQKAEQQFKESLIQQMDEGMVNISKTIVEICCDVFRKKFRHSQTVEAALAGLKAEAHELVLQRLKVNLKRRSAFAYLGNFIREAKKVAFETVLGKIDQTEPQQAIQDLQAKFDILPELIKNNFCEALHQQLNEFWNQFYEELYDTGKPPICRSFCHTFARIVLKIAPASLPSIKSQPSQPNKVLEHQRTLSELHYSLVSSCSTPSSVTNLGKELSEFIEKIALLESIQADFPKNSIRIPVTIQCEYELLLKRPDAESPIGVLACDSDDDDLSVLKGIVGDYQLTIPTQSMTEDEPSSMFVAMADQLYHLENATNKERNDVALAIRHRTLDYILRHYSSPKTKEEFQKLFREPIKNYVDKMKKTEEPGDQLMLHYIAEIYKRRINVWYPNKERPYQIIPRSVKEHSSAADNIGCIRGKQHKTIFTHFISLKLRDEAPAPTREHKKPDYYSQSSSQDLNADHYLVLDTNVLLSDLEYIKGALGQYGQLKVAIPYAVLEELDRLKNPQGDQDFKRAGQARKAIKWISDADPNQRIYQSESEDRAANRDTFRPKMDIRIIKYAVQLRENKHKVKFVSNDINASNFANTFEITTVKGANLQSKNLQSKNQTFATFWKSLK